MEEFEIKEKLKSLSKNGILSNEEQIKLFKQLEIDLKNGTNPENSMARTLLIIANDKLIYKCAKCLVKGFLREEAELELYFYGKEALIKAIDSFEYEKEINFSTYAFHCITSKMALFLNKNIKNSQIEIINTSSLTIEDDEKPIEFEFVDDYNLQEDVTEKVDFETKRREMFATFAYLTSDEQETILYYYGLLGRKPLSCLAISKRMNVVPQTTINRLNSAMFKLKLLNKTSYTKEEKKQYSKIIKKTYELISPVQEFLNKEFNNLFSL